MKFSILYRGSLKTCNYNCWYCPFGKAKMSDHELNKDRHGLEKFADWICSRSSDQVSVMFTPWGEALIHPYYQDVVAGLSYLPHVEKIVIQTNLSCQIRWLDNCNAEKTALWCSFHPGQADTRIFHDKCVRLDNMGLRFSVGAVALREHKNEIRILRSQLPDHIYFWLNAFKHTPDYYTEKDICFFESVDPFFRINTKDYPSRGKECRCGESVLSADENGDIRQCHFIPGIIGNIYTSGIEKALMKRRCTNPTCHCHIGYVHMNDLNLYSLFQDGVLERIPNPGTFILPKK